jgi:hypothetical protein
MDVHSHRSKWWWYLLAEKNRVTMQGGGMAGAGTDLEKAQGGADGAGAQVMPHTYDPMPLLAVASASRSPSSPPLLRSPGAGVGRVESSPQFPPLHELSIYSASEDEGGGGDDYQPDEAHDQENDDGEDDDADWQPTRAKPVPASSRKRTTANRRSAHVVHPVGEEEEEEEEAITQAVAKPSATKGVRVQDQTEAGSMAGCSSPPKRRRVGSISGAGAGPTASGQVVTAQGEGEPAARKLPPRSRLKGLIEWMKSSGDSPPGGPHPPC